MPVTNIYLRQKKLGYLVSDLNLINSKYGELLDGTTISLHVRRAEYKDIYNDEINKFIELIKSKITDSVDAVSVANSDGRILIFTFGK